MQEPFGFVVNARPRELILQITCIKSLRITDPGHPGKHQQPARIQLHGGAARGREVICRTITRMSGRDLTNRLGWLQRMRSWNPLEFKQLDNMTALLAAGVHASNLGICLLDSQTRFESVNAALAHETRASVEHHVGKSSREIVGDLATQIEPTYEKVLAHRQSGIRHACRPGAGHSRNRLLARLLLPHLRQVATSAATGLARCECYRGKGIDGDTKRAPKGPYAAELRPS